MAGALIASIISAHGSDYYWDNNGAVAGFGTASGNWGIDGNWSTNSAGVSTPTVTNTTSADNLYFGTAADGLASGTIQVDSTNQSFNTMTFGQTSGEIVLSNGTLKLAAPLSSIIINNTSNTINSALAGTNGVQVYKDSFAVTHSSYLTPTPTVIFPNAILSNYIGAKGILGGGYITGGTTPATGFYFSNNGTTATYQLQAKNGIFTKCVKVELTQTGSDISARAVYAKYIEGHYLGYDFDPAPYNGTIATSQTENGYGVAEVELLSTCTLTLSGNNTYSGGTTISNGILQISGSGVLGGGSYSGDIINHGTLLYSSVSNQVLHSNISGNGSLILETLAKLPEDETYTSFLPATPESVIILQNTMLADCVAADGVLGGTSITGGTSEGEPFFFENNGTTATWQLQTTNDLPWTKCVKIELTQVGQNIAARVLYAKYINNGSVLGYDFDTGGTSVSIATSDTSSYYGAKQTTLTINRHSTLTLSGTNSFANGTIVNYGRLVATTNASALPSSGEITVNNGGELVLNVPGMSVGNPGGVGNGNPITVNSGGLLTLANNFNTGYSRLITIDGGTLNCEFYENNDCANYMNNLVLMNGAQIRGNKIRLGYHSAVSITASGSSPSSIEAGITMVRNNTSPLTFTVADVTGDDEADLLIPGVIRDYDNNFTNMPLIKAGAGTLSLSAANTHVGTITINEGTITLDGNGSLNAANPVVLSGGTLEMGDYTNTVGTLTVNNPSDIVLGSGEIAFTDSSAATWNSTLTVTGELQEHSVRFGTDDSALTSAQLSAISLNGGSAILTAEGYLAAPPAGTIILIQ